MPKGASSPTGLFGGGAGSGVGFVASDGFAGISNNGEGGVEAWVGQVIWTGAEALQWEDQINKHI